MCLSSSFPAWEETKRKLRSRSIAVCIAALAAIFETLPLQSAAPEDTSNVVREWNELAIKTVRVVSPMNDARAARLYAWVNVAMYDAVNGIVSTHGAHEGRDYAIVPPTGAPPE